LPGDVLDGDEFAGWAPGQMKTRANRVFGRLGIDRHLTSAQTFIRSRYLILPLFKSQAQSSSLTAAFADSKAGNSLRIESIDVRAGA